MNRKLPLLAALSLATVFIVGCGDDDKVKVSPEVAKCGYMGQMGIACKPGSGGTATSSSTVTQTVTITQTSTAN